jgi:peptidyl-prolyl cis-trans isomerase A (cyclophilin A)
MKQFLTMMFVCGAVFAQIKSTAPAAAKSTTAARKVVAPARNLLDPSTLKAKAPEVFKAKLTTTQGDIVIQVTRAWAPIGADRFYNLVRGGFFTNATFFRVIPGFMAQFGISADPKVSAAWNSQDLQDEPVKQSNKRGFLSFAKAGPNTRTTQMFINTADNSANLDPLGFSPIGEVLEGIDLVDKFYSGYGGDPPQGALQQMGKAYTDKNMPKLDYIKTASIVPAVPLAPTAIKSPAAKSTAPATKSTGAKSTTPSKQ